VPTELYVRTNPADATITVDGKQQGVSPNLFEVEPGDHTVVVKLEGYGPATREVTIPDGRIRRVVLQLKKSPEAIDPGLLPKSTEPKKIHLPDADTPGAKVVLDLASGQLLASPDAKNDAARLDHFRRLGKGDLVYDRLLICLRGAKVALWTDNRFVAMPLDFREEQLRACKLPGIPCRLLITTADKKHFDVMILALTEDGGIDLEYRPVDPAEAPETKVEGSQETVKSSATAAAKRFLTALVARDVAKMQSLIAPPPPRWTAEALPELVKEIRDEVYVNIPHRLTEISETLVQDDWAAVRIDGPSGPQGKYLWLVLRRGPNAWRVRHMDDSDPKSTLEKWFKEFISKHGGAELPKEIHSLNESPKVTKGIDSLNESPKAEDAHHDFPAEWSHLQIKCVLDTQGHPPVEGVRIRLASDVTSKQTNRVSLMSARCFSELTSWT